MKPTQAQQARLRRRRLALYTAANILESMGDKEGQRICNDAAERVGRLMEGKEL